MEAVTIEKCTICFKYERHVKLYCCNQHIGKECLDKWLEEHQTCPYCREKIHSLNYVPMEKDIGFKIATIIETLAANGINRICVSPEEFHRIQPYFKDYKRLLVETSNRCCCNAAWYGSNLQILILLDSKTYCEYYVCSDCATVNPKKIWSRLLSARDHLIIKKYGSGTRRIDCELEPLRNELIELMDGKPPEEDLKAIETLLIKYRLKYMGYLNLEKYKFIFNLLQICAAPSTSIGLRVEMQDLMVKWIDTPKTNENFTSFFTKFFFDRAWEIAIQGKGFLGLYPILTLWSIIRDPEESFVEKTKTYESAIAFFKEWEKTIL